MRFLNYIVGVECFGLSGYCVANGHFGWAVFVFGLGIGNFLMATKSKR